MKWIGVGRAGRERAAGESPAAVGGYPAHLLLVPVPMACLVSLVVTDLVFVVTGTEFWSQASLWLGTGGLVTGLVASAFGLVDFATVEQLRRQEAGWRHALSSTAMLLLTGVNVYLRVNDPAGGVAPWGMGLSVAVLGVLGLSASYGGQLSRYLKLGAGGPRASAVGQALRVRECGFTPGESPTH